MKRTLRKADVVDSTALALKLLPPPSRVKLTLLVLANMATAFLDLIGVALVGLLSVLLVSAVQTGSSTPAADYGFVSDLMKGISGQPSGLLLLGIGAACFLVGKSLLGSLLAYRTLIFLARRQAEVSTRLIELLFRRPLVAIEARSTQETAYSLTGGVASAIVGLLGSGALALSELALLTVLGVALLYVNFYVTLSAILFFGLMALFMHLVLGSWAGRNGQLSSTTSYLLTQSIQEALTSFRELTVSDRMVRLVGGLSALIWTGARSTATGVFISQVPKYVYETALLLGALALAAWEFSHQSATQAVATVSVFLAASTRIMPSMLRLQNCLVSIRSTAGQAAPTFNLFRSLEDSSLEAPAMNTRGAVANPPRFIPEIRLRSVVATYPGVAQPALVDADLDVPAGSSVAVVGPTGAGKSTLADVILGILPVDSGDVRIGGMTPHDSIKAFPGMLAYVPQSVSLVSGSVRNNVALGLPESEINDEAVWHALATVKLDDFLRTKRTGLDTEVGERGAKLSGGQRQRLGMARALYSEPRLLVLDEATSALDAETEAAIARALRSLHGRVTTVVIAHRLATVRDADLVVYIEHARILARGSFDEVRAQVRRFDESARLLGL